MLYGADVSNFTDPLSDEQLAWALQSWQFVIIGLQNGSAARAFQRQFAPLHREYYMERPNRDLTIPEPGSMVWIDLEPGCIVSQPELDQCIDLCAAHGLRCGIYGNETSIRPIIGTSAAYAHLPLWYANYGTPDFSRFHPFNGWEKAAILQYSSDGLHEANGINCDLDITEGLAMSTEHYENELNDRRARELLTYHIMNTLQVKVGFAPNAGGLQLTDRTGTVSVVQCDIPDWAAPN